MDEFEREQFEIIEQAYIAIKRHNTTLKKNAPTSRAVMFPCSPPLVDNLIEPHCEKNVEQPKTAFLEFTKKEILKMPKPIRKDFKVGECKARITVRKSGKNGVCYEIRYRRKGYNVCASSTNLQEAKNKFIETLNKALANSSKQDVRVVPAYNPHNVPTLFTDFAMFFFNTYYHKRVSQRTLKEKISQYNKYIKPALEEKRVYEISPTECECLLNGIHSKFGRTAEDIKTILNQILNFAIEYELIKKNPLRKIVVNKHERETGKAISKADERLLLSKINSKHKLPIVLMLYAGLRAGEIYTVRIEGDFVVANNSKRKKGQSKQDKRIAISPMLAPFLKAPVQTQLFACQKTLRDALQETLPTHTLKDLRTTYSTRSQECGIDKVVLDLFLGHSLKGILGQHYTDFSDEYLTAEAGKIKY